MQGFRFYHKISLGDLVSVGVMSWNGCLRAWTDEGLGFASGAGGR